MRYLKFAVIGLLILYILLTGIGLLMPSSVTVGRSVEINAPVDSVRFYTNDPANWRYWINGADTAYYKQLTGSTKDKNSKIELGTYTITVIDNDPKYITTVWQGESSREQLNRLELYYNGSSDITTINWSFQQQLNWYPWERLSAMLRDKVFGPSMEVSLAKLKQVCEK
jgi:Polyketide cyclase / dehydrase and lipid transport